MDNYFTSFRLLVHLSEHQIKATAALNQKKLNNCIIMGNKAFEKKQGVMWINRNQPIKVFVVL